MDVKNIFEKRDLFRPENIKKFFLRKKDLLVIELGEFNLKVALFSFRNSQKK